MTTAWLQIADVNVAECFFWPIAGSGCVNTGAGYPEVIAPRCELIVTKKIKKSAACGLHRSQEIAGSTKYTAPGWITMHEGQMR
jgi:hypothetical protein